MKTASVLASVLIVLALMMACNRATWSEEEIKAVAKTQEEYRTAWLNNDSTNVLNTLSDDIILYPPGGNNVVGKKSVKGFWFPESDTVFVITKFEVTDQEITGSGNHASFIGVSNLEWITVSNDSVLAKSSSKSQFISLMRKIEGRWTIYRQMWNVKK